MIFFFPNVGTHFILLLLWYSPVISLSLSVCLLSFAYGHLLRHHLAPIRVLKTTFVGCIKISCIPISKFINSEIDLVLAQHVMRMRAASVTVQSGPLLTAANAFDVRIFGRGGHGSAPQTTIDPIVIGAAVVMRLQSIVSREVCPGKVAAVSCGSIRAGNTANVIPDYLDLPLNGAHVQG